MKSFIAGKKKVEGIDLKQLSLWGLAWALFWRMAVLQAAVIIAASIVLGGVLGFLSGMGKF